MPEPRLVILDRDYLRALWLEDAVRGVLAAEVRICTRIEEAEQKAFEAVLLGRRAQEGETYGFARQLLARGMPFTWVSNGPLGSLPADLAHAPFLHFPASDHEIVRAVRAMAK